MMINELRLKKKNAKKYYQTLADDMAEFFHEKYNMDIEIEISDKLTIYKAINDVRITENGPQAYIILGIQEITQYNNAIIPDNMAIRPVINLFHELEHIKQFMEFQETTSKNPDLKYMAISRLARNGNDNYYDFNHKSFPFEVKAEHGGVMNGYQYLISTNPPWKANHIKHLILNHVQNETQEGLYYLKKVPKGGFKTIHDIDNAFQEAFEDTKTKQRYYRYDRQNPEDLQGKLWNDIRYADASDEFFKTYNHGMTQDKIIAAMNMQIHPDYIEDFPILQNHIDELNLKTIVQESKTKHAAKQKTTLPQFTATYDSPDF